MATSARIDELRKKFDENPRRYFAPYANEFRKQGDLSQAIALCRTHLPNQPGHISGHIVLAQALYESRELAEARGVFEQALDLDPENLIALRYLGDIAREQGTPAAASSWYKRVLEADPRNDEIRELIRVVDEEAAAAVAELSRQPTPVSTPVVEPVEAQEEQSWDAHPHADPLNWVGEPAQADSAEPSIEALASSPTPPFSPVQVHHDLGELEAVAEPEHTDWFAAPEQAAAVRASDEEFPEFPADLAEAAEPLAERLSEAQAQAPVAEAADHLEINLGSLEVGSQENAGSGYESPEFVPLAGTIDLSDAAAAPEPVAAELSSYEPEAVVADVSSFEPEPIVAEVSEFEPEPIVAEVPASEPEPVVAEVSPFASDELDAPVAAVAPREEVEFEAMFDEVALPASEPVEAAVDGAIEAAFDGAADASVDDRVEAAVDAASGEWDPMVGRTPAFNAPVSEEPPAPFVTETMAELYLQQGFDEEALAIYRQLLAQDPADDTLRARVEALEAGARSPTVTPLQTPALEPRGPSIRDFFRSIATRGVDVASPVDDRPVAIATVVDDVAVRATSSFSGVAHADEALTQPDADDVRGGDGLAAMFREQAPNASDELAAQSLAGAFGLPSTPVAPELSLDALFGQLPSAQADAVTSAFRAGSSEPSVPLTPGPDGEANADVEQFTAWLEGLKKK